MKIRQQYNARMKRKKAELKKILAAEPAKENSES